MERTTHISHHAPARRTLLFTLALTSLVGSGACVPADPAGGGGSSGGAPSGSSSSSSGGGRPSSSGGASSSSGGVPSSSGSASSSSGSASSSSGGVASSSGSAASSSSGASSGNGGSSGASTYELDPPDPCYNQFYVQGCVDGNATSTCGGKCKVANACSPPESADKASLPKTFACPRHMLFSDEMKQAARDDAAAYGWGTASDPAFNYAVVGHDADDQLLDKGAGTSTCCQCYQLVFEKPEPGSAQPPDLPIPRPMIVQSFNTAAGGGKNFDIFMGAGGFGAFNACVPGSYSGTQTTTFGRFQYTAFPAEYNGQGGVKFINLDECKVNGGATVATLTSAACQGRIGQLCDAASAPSAATTRTTRASCKEGNLLASAYHQNWSVRVKKVECPPALTRVTGCRLAAAGLPQPDPKARTVASADGTFLSGYTTTTMQDCCKPTCAWRDYTTGRGLKVVGSWSSFYSCDENGVPITAAAP